MQKDLKNFLGTKFTSDKDVLSQEVDPGDILCDCELLWGHSRGRVVTVWRHWTGADIGQYKAISVIQIDKEGFGKNCPIWLNYAGFHVFSNSLFQYIRFANLINASYKCAF